jgi:hypothetical protein
MNVKSGRKMSFDTKAEQPLDLPSARRKIGRYLRKAVTVKTDNAFDAGSDLLSNDGQVRTKWRKRGLKSKQL